MLLLKNNLTNFAQNIFGNEESWLDNYFYALFIWL